MSSAISLLFLPFSNPKSHGNQYPTSALKQTKLLVERNPNYARPQ